ncbi:related to proliferation associated SNF2-like protein [Pseudozyma flocculosa]|uniref:Related to proliferation associated SNF2-like protein n=1 Tax=Pseudozyma flocculosa TaxID=84751 RepID=A0A5C3F538_9BASI|nr:related to proliferation associated SNF2-like protein [Pseudozyma flocculosa]
MAPTADNDDKELLRAAAQADGNAESSGAENTPDRRDRKPTASSQKPEEDPAVHDERIKKLKFLLKRSGVYSRIMGEKMEKERKARAEAAAKEAAKQQRRDTAQPPKGSTKGQSKKERDQAGAPNASSATTTRRSTRHGDAAAEDAATSSATTRSRRGGGAEANKKRKAEGYDVSAYLDEQDLEQAGSEDPAKKQKKNDGSAAAKATGTGSDDPAAKVQAEAAEAEAHAAQEGRDVDVNGDGDDDGDGESKEKDHRTQPKLVTGATMRDYQLDGLEWLVSLYENGLNGILADEMGLGKTLQTISFLAHLRGKNVWGPFLIVAPLSTINNWVLEFRRFTPDIPVIMYHGTGDERREMRRTYLQTPTIRSEQLLFPVVVTSYEVIIRDRAHLANHPWKFIVVDEGHRLKNLNCRLVRELKAFKSANRLILTGTPLHNNLAELWSLLNFILPDIFDDLATFEAWFDFSDIHEDGANRILTKMDSANIITQLHEILKPFLLRRLKADVEANLPPKKEYLLYAPLTRMQKDLYDSIVRRDIRKSLLVRKTGLEWDEIQEILDDPDGTNTPTTATATRESSRAASPKTAGGRAKAKGNGHANGNGNGHAAAASSTATPGSKRSRTAPSTPALHDDGDGDDTPTSRASTPARRSTRRAARAAKGGYGYNDAEDDGAYFNRLEVESRRAPRPLSPAAAERQGKLYAIKEAQKSINNMHLENMVMQARKVCNHPFLFDWPIDPDTGSFVVNKNLINASGKMLMLNRLLDELFARGHKVLIFSQFTTMLDIIEDWANEYKELRTCRIDGSTSQVDRREQMRSFNEDTGPDACNLFLLSTRAGGLGINLVAADTVIFFDSDWNPQMDLQAQDRVHRIGQTKPCLIFRLVSANTVEQRILKRAGNKRKLEALVIQQGKFRLPAGYNAGGAGGVKRKKEDEMAEMASNLLKLEGEQVQLAGEDDEIISQANLEKLLDRSPAAYERRTGWVTSRSGGEGDEAGGQAAFEVTETVVDEANEEIAKLLAGGGGSGGD